MTRATTRATAKTAKAAPPPQPITKPTRLRDRPTGDLLLMSVAGTIALVVVLTTISILVTEIVHPNADTSTAATLVSDTLAALLALLAGFLAGRTGGPKPHPEKDESVQPG